MSSASAQRLTGVSAGPLAAQAAHPGRRARARTPAAPRSRRAPRPRRGTAPSAATAARQRQAPVAPCRLPRGAPKRVAAACSSHASASGAPAKGRAGAPREPWVARGEEVLECAARVPARQAKTSTGVQQFGRVGVVERVGRPVALDQREGQRRARGPGQRRVPAGAEGDRGVRDRRLQLAGVQGSNGEPHLGADQRRRTQPSWCACSRACSRCTRASARRSQRTSVAHARK